MYSIDTALLGLPGRPPILLSKNSIDVTRITSILLLLTLPPVYIKIDVYADSRLRLSCAPYSFLTAKAVRIFLFS